MARDKKERGIEMPELNTIVSRGHLESAERSTIKTIIVHADGDTDSMLCAWAAYRFGGAEGAEIVEVDASTPLPEMVANPKVRVFDVGEGQFDQHNKHRQDITSFD